MSIFLVGRCEIDDDYLTAQRRAERSHRMRLSYETLCLLAMLGDDSAVEAMDSTEVLSGKTSAYAICGTLFVF